MRYMEQFTAGQKVRCIDAAMEGCGPALTEGRIYTIQEFCPPKQVDLSEYSARAAQWELNGGWVRLEEEGPPANRFYARRFTAIN